MWIKLKARIQQCRLTLTFLNWFALSNTIIICLISLPYLRVILSSRTLFLYQGTNLGILPSYEMITLTLGLATAYLGQCALLAYLPAILLAVLSMLIARHRIIVTLAILLATLTVIILFVDIKIFLTYHFHLNFKVIPAVSRTDLSITEWWLLAAICMSILIAQAMLSYLVHRYLIPQKKWQHAGELCAYLWPVFLLASYCIYIGSVGLQLSTLAQQTPSLPLYNQILAVLIKHSFYHLDVSQASEASFSQPQLPNDILSYPKHRLVFRSTHKKPYNIVMIVIDTWRFDAMNAKLTPRIHHFATHAWQFNNHFSGGNSTEAGLTSLLYGLPHLYWESLKSAKRGTVLIDALHEHGYQTNVFFSSFMVPRFDQTAFAAIKNIRTVSAPGKTIPDRDRTITQEWYQFIQQRDKQKPFFTFSLYDAAHGYCAEQNFKKVYKKATTDCSRLLYTNEKIQKIHDRYRNAIYFLDDEVGFILDKLKQENLLDNTIVILTGDHGEEFFDTVLQNAGHASNYSIYQIKVPMIVHWPKQAPKIWAHTTSHYDVVPTLMREMLNYKNPFKDYSLGGKILWDTHTKEDYILVGSYVNTAIVETEKGQHTALLASGDIEINDMEGRPIPNAKLNTSLVSRALNDLRWFYQNAR